jgi:hypothetical protein
MMEGSEFDHLHQDPEGGTSSSTSLSTVGQNSKASKDSALSGKQSDQPEMNVKHNPKRTC